MKGTRFGLQGLMVTAVIHVTIGVLIVTLADASDDEKDEGPDLSKMEAIEVSLARKTEEEVNQPQKKRKPKPKTKEHEVITDDPDKMDEEEEEEQEEEFDPEKAAQEFIDQRQNEDVEEGEETPEAGNWQGHEEGWAEVDKGHPYMRELVKDLRSHWNVPTLETSESVAEACLELEPDGKITKTELATATENATIDRSVKLALDKLAEARKDGDKPVPPDLLAKFNGTICFRLRT